MSNLRTCLEVPSRYEDRRITRSMQRDSDSSTSVTSGSTGSATLAPKDSLVLAHRPAPYLRQATGLPQVKGFVYSAGTLGPRSRLFKLKPSTSLDFGGRTIPDVHIAKVIRIPRGTTVHHSFVTYAGRTFSVYRFNSPTFPLNDAIMAMKRTTEWRGDVLVFSVGLYKALLKSPNTEKETLDTVACIFVARVTECRDLGLGVPLMIEA